MSAEPTTVSLWHVFNLETDMIYPGMKAFNASQSEYRIEPRLVPGVQMVTELIRAIATGSVPAAGAGVQAASKLPASIHAPRAAQDRRSTLRA